jgi:hypothetical protein
MDEKMTTLIKASELATALQTFNGSFREYKNNKPVQKSLDKKEDWNFGEGNSANFALNGKVSFHVLNDKTDLKGDIMVTDQASQSSDVSDLSKPLILNGESSFTRYQFGLSIESNLSGSLDDLGFKWDISAGADFTNYFTHNIDERLLDGLASDLASMPFIINPEDVVSLEEGEGLAMSVAGSISLEAEFKWSHLLSDSISLLSDVVSDEALLLKVNAALSIKMNLTLSGAFTLIFARKVASDKITLALKKSETKSTAISTLFEVGVEFSDSGAVESFVNNHVDDLFKLMDKGSDTTNSIIQKVESATNFSEIQALQPYIEQLADILDIDPVSIDLIDATDATIATNYLKELQDKIKAKKKSIINKIEDFAKTNAKLSLAYDYNRIKQTDSILEALINKSIVPTIHKDCVLGNFDNVLRALNEASTTDDAQITKFFKQVSITTTSSFGINFSIWKLKSSNITTSTVSQITSYNRTGHKMITFDGTKYNTYSLGEDKGKFYVDFDAHMKSFSKRTGTVSADEFEYQLSFGLEVEGSREAAHLADQAETWGVIAGGEVDRLRDELLDKTITKVVCKTQTVNDLTSNLAVFEALSTVSSTMMAKALAAALPKKFRHSKYRQTAQIRQIYYTPVFEHILAAGGRMNRLDVLSRLFRRNAGTKYAHQEFSQSMSNRIKDRQGTVGYMLAKQPNWYRDIIDMKEGFGKLAAAIHSGENMDSIRKAYYLFDDSGKHAFYARFMGALLNEIRLSAPELQPVLNSTMQITYEENGKEFELLVGDYR